MKKLLLVAVSSLAVVGMIAMTGVAGAHSRANTKVTIHYNGDGFQGKLKSSKAKCKRNRTVKVFKKNVGLKYTDTSEDDGSWNTGNSGKVHGTFYAHTGKIPGCKGGTSKSIHIS